MPPIGHNDIVPPVCFILKAAPIFSRHFKSVIIIKERWINELVRLINELASKNDPDSSALYFDCHCHCMAMTCAQKWTVRFALQFLAQYKGLSFNLSTSISENANSRKFFEINALWSRRISRTYLIPEKNIPILNVISACGFKTTSLWA